ncbi:MAG: alanine--tRNA ligase, partial [Flavobacteriales bacterium]|nr:alanine--tRNA ligase [Flavobacteriales bacterium]
QKKDIAFRVIVDHIRAISFSIADGQLPSNTGAGYVIRRILRRAVRYGYSFLDLKKPFLYQLVGVLNETLGEQFVELDKQQQLIEKVIYEEEQSFLSTLEKGIQLFENYTQQNPKTISGDFAFELYDTFGFPIDLTQLLAIEKNLKVDMEVFEANLKTQKDRSRNASKIDAQDWVELLKDEKEEFIGYDYNEAKIKITRYRKVNQKGKDFYQLVFNLSPFYPEGGGQVGDTGFIDNGEEKIEVFDTKKENNLIIHFTDKLPKNLKSDFNAEVSKKKRKLTAANHSATHLLHETLRTVLGLHVEQKGSLVNSEYLRFDFSHFQKLTFDEIREIESKVNAKIRANIPLNEERTIPLEEARSKGAMALFGEKYGDVVRMIQFGTSVELCGGIHVQATGEIGLFKIVSEGAVAAGIRRIEAISSERALDLFFEQNDMIQELKSKLKNPKNIGSAIENLQVENSSLQKELESFKAKAAGSLKDDLLKKVIAKDGIQILIEEVDLDAAGIKNVAFQLKAEVNNLFMVLGTKKDAKPSLTVLISDNLVEEKDWNAGTIVRNLAKHIQGGGGGQAFFATAGGKNPDGLAKALEEARGLV